jgi:hypothetical protein
MTEETTKIRNAMDSGNYTKILDKIDPKNSNHQFDITTSRMLFDSGSGIEQTVENRPFEDEERRYERASEEVLKVLSATTKQGGISIHLVGFSDGMIFGKDEEKKLAKLGFKKANIFSEDGLVRNCSQHYAFTDEGQSYKLDDAVREFFINNDIYKGCNPYFSYPVVVLEKIK